MSVTYWRRSGFVFSDAKEFSDWEQEISVARDRWYEETMAANVPQWVYRKAHSQKQSDRDQAASFMRTDGWMIHQDEPHGVWIITHKGAIVSRFIIVFQRPTLGKCRICGEPLPPGYKTETDTHATCDVRNYLMGKILRQKTTTGADLPPGPEDLATN
jgi:hypothetical protein